MMPRYIDPKKPQDRAYRLRFGARISDRELAIVNRLLIESPTEDVAPVIHALWRFNENNHMFYCTNCNEEMVRSVYSYCPWCGAKMEEEK